ncbi:MAG: DNA translocase FtsK 4TM domain-containing protein [Patescibacteria group bacterium]|nr:DNA translocase FtsK 4TM domain-containing protein [Patescibacteria group bacterium]
MTRKKRRRNYSESKFRFPEFEIGAGIKKDAVGIFLFALALISVLSFVNLAGGLGERISEFAKLSFGIGAFLFPVLLIFLGWKTIKSEDIIESRISLVGVAMIFVFFLSLVHIFYVPEVMFEIAKEEKGGGFLGAAIAWILASLIGKWGGLVVILALILISLLLTFNISFVELVEKIKPKKREREDVKENKEDDIEEEEKDEEVDDIKINIAGREKEKRGVLSLLAGKLSKNKKPPEFSVRAMDENDDLEDEAKEAEEDFTADKNSEELGIENIGNKNAELGNRNIDWKMPPLSLLDRYDKDPTSGDIKANSNIIKRTLANFGVQVEMGEVNVGPTVTQYTLKPAVGVKLSRIIALNNDLALALAAHSIRIEAPIPGKSYAGIEIPNQSIAMVRLKNILASGDFENRKSNLSIILGRDVSGKAILANLAKMPHLMIAGSTGSGKTVCINTLITGLLYQNSPEDLKFIMVDPKRVELTSYNDIPHLLTPVITDPDKAINSLKWSISEMEKRYELLSHLGCRNIESYNLAVKTKYQQRETLPYIIVVIDELADLMATHGREMEAAIVRLAQMARAIGIHLILSTQRPSIEVITGLIKANITTRIAFQVASQIDSRTILDMSGAEKLLGSGDMLYLSGDSNKPTRIQGVFISEEETKKVTDFLKNQKGAAAGYDEEIIEDKKSSSLEFSDNDSGEMEDDLYNDALEVVKEAGKASASLLQRRLRVGYARAARLLDIMEDKGIIGPADGAKPREVYADDFEEEEV